VPGTFGRAQEAGEIDQKMAEGDIGRLACVGDDEVNCALEEEIMCEFID
jgi:nitroimidazol reductase NimA-like FMN-containing flavoprotein (pyridoxamine 5'-phosphate oxidase superfamily)